MKELNGTIFECEDDTVDDVDGIKNSRDRIVDEDSDSSGESDSDGIILNFDKGQSNNSSIKKKRERKESAPSEETAKCFPESSSGVTFRPLAKVPTVATDQEIAEVLESRQKKSRVDQSSISPRKARAMRRKLYLDLYKEVSSKMLI